MLIWSILLLKKGIKTLTSTKTINIKNIFFLFCLNYCSPGFKLNEKTGFIDNVHNLLGIFTLIITKAFII